MEILGIGMPELIFIIIIALLVLGPKDMEKAGRTIGRFLRNLVTSDGWKLFQQTSRDLRTLPNRLMREANDELDLVNRELKNAASTPDVKRIDPANRRLTPQPYSATPAPEPGSTTEASSTAPDSKETERESPNDA